MDIKAVKDQIHSKIDQLQKKLEALPPSRKKLLLIVPPLLVVVLAVYFLVMPAIQEKRRLEEEISKQMLDIGSLQKRTARLPELLVENKRLEDKLKELLLQLPVEKEVSGLLRQVSVLGVKSGLQVISWKPRDKAVHAGNEVYDIPVDVEMRGTYHMFGQFFSNITKLNRIVNITNITMKPGDQKFMPRGVAGLNVSFAAITYSLIPEQEKKELAKKGQKK